jgi:hypothetical protein
VNLQQCTLQHSNVRKTTYMSEYCCKSLYIYTFFAPCLFLSTIALYMASTGLPGSRRSLGEILT